MPDTPLILDLDGTLIRSDTTFDLCIAHVKRRWIWGIVELLFWFVKSRSAAKRRLAERYVDDYAVDTLPFTDLVDHAIVANAHCKIIVSGSDDLVVQKIVASLDWVDSGYGSQPGTNLTADNKRAFLEDKFPDGFDYAGDSDADLEVWPKARRAYGVGVSKSRIARAKKAGIALEVLSQKPNLLKTVVKACRLHQWAKNGLLATMPFLGLSQFSSDWFLMLSLAFVAFGLVASATYILNDLLDIQADRAHKTKRNRPLASGRLSIPLGIAVMAITGAGGFALALGLHHGFFRMLVGYTALSLAYSFYLKRVPVLDTMFLSLLFCWRILAGGVLLGLESSPWLILSLWFFFFGLALGKRAIELADKPASDAKIAGRGYVGQDFPIITVAGVAASFASVIVIFIYSVLVEAAVIQREISIILIVVLLVFWQLRFWLLVGRREVHDDPVVFALKDKTSFVTLGALGAVMAAEQFLPEGAHILSFVV